MTLVWPNFCGPQFPPPGNGESPSCLAGGGVLALHSRRSVEAISLLPLCSKSFHGHMVTSTLPWEVPRSEQGP